MSAVVRADISLVTAVVICLQHFKYACISVTVSVTCLGEVAVFKMLDVSDMSESYSVTVFANDFRNVVVGL